MTKTASEAVDVLLERAKSKKETNKVVVTKTVFNTDYLNRNDLVKVIDTNHGEWYYGIITNISSTDIEIVDIYDISEFNEYYYFVEHIVEYGIQIIKQKIVEDS